MMRHIAIAGCLTAMSLVTGQAVAQAPPLQDRILILGEVAPKSAAEIVDNDWSIGTETIDRDFSTHAAWREYLGPLGAKHARLHSAGPERMREPASMTSLGWTRSWTTSSLRASRHG